MNSFMSRFAFLLCAAPFFCAPSAAAEPKPQAPKYLTTAEVLAASTPEDWRRLDPADTLYLDIAAGRVRQVGDSVAVKRGYWLVAPTPQWRQAKVKALVAALTA